MRDAEHLREDMEFQLSLLRLMTVPHENGVRAAGVKPEGEEQLVRLFEVADSGYRN